MRVRVHIGFCLIFMWVATACTLNSQGGGVIDPQTIEGPPVVQITAPLPNATYLQDVDVDIRARIENAGPDIQRVEILLDDQLLGTSGNAPNASGAFTFTIQQRWSTSTPGTYKIGVIAYRNDGEQSLPAEVTVNIVSQEDAGVNPNPPPTRVAQVASQTPRPTDTPGVVPAPSTDTPPQQIAASNTPGVEPAPSSSDTPSSPQLVISNPTGANVRRGPGTNFDIMGGLAQNDTAAITGINPSGDWYKIRYENAEGWVWAQLTQPSGPLNTLQVDQGPPPPTAAPPPTATTIPPTPLPASQVNFQVVNIQISPHPLVCNEASEIQVTIRNEGSAGSTEGGIIGVSAVLVSSGGTLASTSTTFPPLAPGQQHTASAFLTVTTNTNEQQRIAATVDSSNQVAESDESDNSSSAGTDYILAKGACP